MSLVIGPSSDSVPPELPCRSVIVVRSTIKAHQGLPQIVACFAFMIRPILAGKLARTSCIPNHESGKRMHHTKFSSKERKSLQPKLACVWFAISGCGHPIQVLLVFGCQTWLGGAVHVLMAVWHVHSETTVHFDIRLAYPFL